MSAPLLQEPWEVLPLQGVSRLFSVAAAAEVVTLRPARLTSAGLACPAALAPRAGGPRPAPRYPRLAELDLSGVEGHAVSDELLSLVAQLHEDRLRSLSLERAEGFSAVGLWTCLPRLCHLTSLSLAWCYDGVTDAGMSGVGALPALTSLDITSCKRVTDRGIVALRDHGALTSLKLCGVERLTARGLLGLGSLPKLTHLDLSWCWLNSEALVYFPGCFPVLERLVMAEVVRVASVGALAGCSALTDLDLRGATGLQDIQGLWALPSLSALNISRCDRINMDNFDGIHECPSLRHMDVGGCNRRPPDQLPRGLTSLRLANCLYLSDKDLDDVALQGLRGLTALNCSGCHNLTFLQHLPRSIGGLASITSLDVSYLRNLSEKGLEVVAELPRLKHLDVSACHLLSDAAARVLAARFPALEVLTARRLAMTDLGLGHYARCPGLRRLDITQCPLVTPRGLAGLLEVGGLVVVHDMAQGFRVRV